MYFETGLGQPSKRRRKVVVSQPRLVPVDQLFYAETLWRLKVPFRRDLGAFRQEVAMAIGRHVIKDAGDITKVDEWILKREENERLLKAIHTDLQKLAKKESDIVIVRTRYTFLRGVDSVVSQVKIVRAEY